MAKKKLDKGNLPTVVEPGNNPLAYKAEFDTIYGIISAHKKRAMYAVHNESLNMLWEVGAYVSDRLKKAAWGDGVVRMLADYIRTQSPKAKGWSYRTIYKMVQSEMMKREYPQSGVLFKDTVYLEMFGLPVKYKESKLRKEIIAHMKDFIHIEALDQEERRSNENPSIGIILCKDADMEVVRYALNRSMSPTMVALYKEQLQVGGVIQRSLVEFCRFVSKRK